jgi:hypothetical protein
MENRNLINIRGLNKVHVLRLLWEEASMDPEQCHMKNHAIFYPGWARDKVHDFIDTFCYKSLKIDFRSDIIDCTEYNKTSNRDAYLALFSPINLEYNIDIEKMDRVELLRLLWKEASTVTGLDSTQDYSIFSEELARSVVNGKIEVFCGRRIDIDFTYDWIDCRNYNNTARTNAYIVIFFPGFSRN